MGRYFEIGAKAIERYLGTAEYYICPQCMCGFPVEAIHELTVEHVPPEKLDGRGIILTCKACNNSSGAKLDAAMILREQQHRFRQMVLGKDDVYKGMAQWTVAGETLNVQVYRHGKYLRIEGIPALNSRAVVERITENRSLTGKLTTRIRYRWRRAAVGDLRVAYLAATALLGYRYSFHLVFDAVREQIAKPDVEILSRWSIDIDPHVPVRRTIFEASAPWHCLVVQVDRVAVLLPIPGSSDNLYQELPTIGNQLQMELRYNLGWPTGMVMREDFVEDSPLPFPSLHEEKDEPD